FAEKLKKKNITTGTKFCNRLLEETGVAILPGVDFNRPAGELSARLSYVDFDGAKALEASYLIPLDKPLPDNFLEQHCNKVIDAAKLMVEWVNA
ncbi:MAG: hypothetical protein KDB92_08695, partial [Chitinophagaceae bacterium]|nr:hypothetical protein [Chitinophagaceae bacterium]